jgi:hypothetical protein
MANVNAKDPNRPLLYVRKRLLATELQPALRYLIKPVLIRGTRPGSRMILLFGPQEGFKSNMAVTLILHFYTGLPFCGMRVPKIESLYINPDNPDGAIKCAQAWFKFHRERLAKIGITSDAIIDAVIFERPVNLRVRDELDVAIEDIRRQDMHPGLLAMDTVWHNSGGADLKEPSDAQTVCENMRYFITGVGAFTGLALHHPTKDGKVMFGGSPFWVYSDSIVEVTPDAGHRSVTLSPVKMRGPWFDELVVTFDSIDIDTLPDDEGNCTEKQWVLASFNGRGAGAEVGEAPRPPDEDVVRIEQLVVMVSVLREKFGNRATRGDWQKHMQEFGEKGWSERSFDRRLEALKARRWVGIVGDPQAIPSGRKILQGELYEATELAPIVGRDGTTWKDEKTERSASQSTASQSTATPNPLGGLADGGSAFLAPKDCQAPPNHRHGSGGSGSSKNGNGANLVVSDLTGEALLEAARRQLGLPPKG